MAKKPRPVGDVRVLVTFMKTVAALGATAFLTTYKSEIVNALAEVKDYWHICWLNGAACTGCTISFAQATHPDLVEILTSITVGNSGLPIALPDYIETIHPASGTLAESLKECWAGGEVGKRILVVEGALQKPGWCVIAGKDFREHVSEAAEIADYVVAFGACACYGGIPSANPNPTGAMGVLDFFKEIGVGKLVINLPLCPGHPDHLVLTLASVILGVIPELDQYNRPRMFFGKGMHDELCPYRPYYDRGIFAKVGEDGCRYKLGCKGPLVHTDCSLRKWNRTSYCVEVGAPCIGCAEPGFPDRFSPFYKELPGLPTVLGIDATTLGEGLIAATAAGIAIHAIKRAAKGKKE
jgi:hydrogenase small subunit